MNKQFIAVQKGVGFLRFAKEKGLTVVTEIYILLSAYDILKAEREKFPGIEPEPNEELVKEAFSDVREVCSLTDWALAPSEAVRQDLGLAVEVIYEALATGIPVIATETAGSVVRDGIEGFIVPERDAVALANRIEEVVKNRSWREEMASAAKERAKDYTLEKYAERLIDVFKCV